MEVLSNDRRICKWGSYLRPTPTELILATVSIKILSTIHGLCDPNYWFAGTGASVHSTAYPDFEHNCCPVNIRDSIMAAQGAIMLPDQVGEIIGALMDKEGKMQFHLFPTVKEVHVVPQGVFNLWSVTKSLSEGWSVTGDSESIELTRGLYKFRFGIKVHTG